jgi:hypothetical protein
VHGRPKSGNARTVRIPRFLANALNDHLQAFTPLDPEALVFPATSFRMSRTSLQTLSINSGITEDLDLRRTARRRMYQGWAREIASNPYYIWVSRSSGGGT